jgi:hypothetical protein
LQWLYDLLFYAETPLSLLEALAAFFKICRTGGLKIHAKKRRLFLQEVRWCGRFINKDGVRLDSNRLRALLEMPAPVHGNELQQFVCAASWMLSVIPEFTALIAPLAASLEAVYAAAGTRTRRGAAKILLADVSWDVQQVAAFASVKGALHRAATVGFCAAEANEQNV